MVDITKVYTGVDVGTTALKDIDLVVKKGEFLAITGRSGSGKSTLMHVIGLLDTPTSGTYFLNGTDVSKLGEDEQAFQRNKEIGFVFQSFNLLPKSSAVENVILPAIYAGTSPKERMEKAVARWQRDNRPAADHLAPPGHSRTPERGNIAVEAH